MEGLQSHSLPASDGIYSTGIVRQSKLFARQVCVKEPHPGEMPIRYSRYSLWYIFDKRYPAKFRFQPLLLQIILPGEMPFVLGNTLKIDIAFQQLKEAHQHLPSVKRMPSRSLLCT